MNGNGDSCKKDIVSALKLHPEGLTIADLSEILSAHRQTITKYILVLEASGVVYRRRVGSATLHYLKEQFVKSVEQDILTKLKERLV